VEHSDAFTTINAQRQKHWMRDDTERRLSVVVGWLSWPRIPEQAGARRSAPYLAEPSASRPFAAAWDSASRFWTVIFGGLAAEFLILEG
jgi:hypothetical protein